MQQMVKDMLAHLGLSKIQTLAKENKVIVWDDENIIVSMSGESITFEASKWTESYSQSELFKTSLIIHAKKNCVNLIATGIMVGVLTLSLKR